MKLYKFEVTITRLPNGATVSIVESHADKVVVKSECILPTSILESGIIEKAINRFLEDQT